MGMRRFVILTLLVGMLLLYLGAAVVNTQRLEGGGPLGVSGADLLDQGTLARLRLVEVSSGGVVTGLLGHGVLVHNRQGRALQIRFAHGAQFVERGQSVTAAALEIGAHLRAQALHPGGTTYIAYKVLISPHHHAVGGRIVSSGGVLEILDRHNRISLVQVLPGAAISLDGRPYRATLAVQTHVLALAYRDPDPLFQGIYLADAVHVLPAIKSQRYGGVIRRIDPVRSLVQIYSKTQNRIDTVEIKPTTQVTLSSFSSGIADMRVGDHLTVVGTPDAAGAELGPNPVIARIVRISSPNFGGVITAIGAAPGMVVLTVRGHHGRLLRIDAPTGTLIYAQSTAGQQTGSVADLFVGEHIAAKGKRLGKFELQAGSIHVYPHQHTIGGTVAAITAGRLLLRASDGTVYIVHTSSGTVYYLNGKLAGPSAVRIGVHVKVRGTDALRSDQRGTLTMLASRISVTVHVHTTRPSSRKTTKPSKTAGTPTPTPRRTQGTNPATGTLPRSA
jgi:hypothetical protein